MNGNKRKIIPIGIESFEEIRQGSFYYIDKTEWIKELLENPGKVNLFTRPRRFGKSLNMSMLRCFFEPGTEKRIFDGLKIAGEHELCKSYMGKFPVIAVSLKDINGLSYEMAQDMAAVIVKEEIERHPYLLDSDQLSKLEKEKLRTMLCMKMGQSELCSGLKVLSRLLYQHHHQKVIVLIDEYDVPLAKAFANGYYDQMVTLMQTMFGLLLKTNEYLQFAVLTGCLRIAKESIFTGLNNLKVLSMQDVRFDACFGFTDGEVRNLLDAYDLADAYGDVKNWYDGYRFGNTQIYCPWDVLNYCDLLLADRDAPPQDFWSNTSDNDVIRHFIENAHNKTTKQEIERLVAGEAVAKKLRKDLTYRDLYGSIDNIWSGLFTTGYLTLQGRPDGDLCRLVIPNMEIRKVFTEQIMEYFRETVRKDGEALEQFCEALKNADAYSVQEQFGKYLKKAVSIRDTFVKRPMKENYYHGILMGLLAYKDAWAVFSNRESGEGYSDILVEIEDEEIGIVIEVKYSDQGNLHAACKEALIQIEQNDYAQQLYEDGVQTVLKYGIACYKKRCMVMLGDTCGSISDKQSEI